MFLGLVLHLLIFDVVGATKIGEGGVGTNQSITLTTSQTKQYRCYTTATMRLYYNGSNRNGSYTKTATATVAKC